MTMLIAAPMKMVADLDALSKSLQLPMPIGQSLLPMLTGGAGPGGVKVERATLERLDEARPLAVIWLASRSGVPAGWCAALAFKEPGFASEALQTIGTLVVQNEGVSQRKIPSGDMVWGAVKDRQLMLSGSQETLLAAGALAITAQTMPMRGQALFSINPSIMAKSTGQQLDALAARRITDRPRASLHDKVSGFRLVALVEEGLARARLGRAATAEDGVQRFLARLWRLAAEQTAVTDDASCFDRDWQRRTAGPVRELLAKAHWAIDKAGRDFERGFQFNTVIAAVMELVNEAYRLKDDLHGDGDGDRALRFAAATAASLIFPFAPHLGAEAWELLVGGRVWEEPWPTADAELLASDVITLVVQVNGKLRDRVEVAADATDEQILELVHASERLRDYLAGREPVKEIVVPGRLVNLVVR